MNYFFFFGVENSIFLLVDIGNQWETTETEGFIFFPPMEETPKKKLDLAWPDSNLMTVLVC